MMLECTRDGLVHIALWTALFFVVRVAFAGPFTRWVLPQLEGEKSLLWSNTAVSYIHAVIVAVGSSYLFLREPASRADLIYTQSDVARHVLALSTGYFIADTFDMLRNRLYFRVPSIYLHHGIILATFVSACAVCLFHPYMVGTLLVEINGVFLHQRGLWKEAGRNTSSLLYRINLFFLFATFLPFRMGVHAYLFYRVIIDYYAFPTLYSFALAFGGLLIMNVYNTHLLRGLYRSDIAKRRPKVTPTKAE